MITRSAATVAALFVLSLTACSGADSAEPGPATGGKKSSSSGGETSSGGTTEKVDLPPPPATSKACELPAKTATDVTPTFLTYDPPNTQPPAQKGGKVDGTYTIDKATVYLPTGTKGLVRLAQSTGKVNGWATFKGEDYRLSLKADLAITPILGAVRNEKIDAQGQGTFATEGSAITLKTACPGSTTPAAAITFSENGNRGTLVVKQAVADQGDAYIFVEAVRVQ